MAERGNPVGMFGMIYVLEGLGQGEGGVAGRKIQEGLGLPKEACQFLIAHAELDVKHLRDAKRTMIEHVHDAADERAIIYMARAAFELYAFLFDQIWERYEASLPVRETVPV
jgi:pyrroloquinoline quinone (PQQ) biosynthesis protein C